MPTFSDRPTHPDFMRMSHVVILNDLEAEHGDGLNTQVAKYADMESLTYMAEQRTGRFIDMLGYPQPLRALLMPVLMAAYMDGFCLGVGFQQEGGKA